MNRHPLSLFMLIMVFSPLVLVAQSAPPRFGLEELVKYALQHSPELQKLQFDLEYQRENTILERAKFDLRLDYEASHTIADNQTDNTVTLTKQFLRGVTLTTATGITSDSGTGSDSSYFSVTLTKKLLGSDSTLDDTRKAIDDSLVDELIALNTLNQRQRQIVFQVSSAFYKTIRDVQSKGIQERRLERARRNLEMAIEREKPLDIITARIQIPENELAVVKSDRSIANDIESLQILLGMPLDQPFAVSEDFTFLIRDTDAEESIQYALEHHEEFLNNRLQHRKLERDCRIARSELWPDISIEGTHYGESDPESHSFDSGDKEQTITLELGWQLGRRTDKANYRRAFNRLEKNERDYFILTQKRTAQLLDLDRNLRELARSIELQEQRIGLVTRQVELYRDRYDNGEIDILEFIRSQNDLEDSKVGLIELQTTYMETLANYNFQAGR